MPRVGRVVGAGAVTSWLLACSLFTDLDGLDDPLPPASIAERPDGAVGEASAPPIMNNVDGGAPDAGPYRPKHQRGVVIKNNAKAPLPASSTQCFDQTITDAGTVNVRPDFGDLRVFGATGERARSVDLVGSAVRLCFSLEREIAAGATDRYSLRYGDPDAQVPLGGERALFAFWEPFDQTLDGVRWGRFGEVSIANGELTIVKGTRGSGIATTAALDNVPEIASLELRVKVVDPFSAGSPETFQFWFGFQRQGDFEATYPYSVFISRSPGAVRAEVRSAPDSGACAAGCIGPDTPPRNDYQVYRIDRYPGKTVFTSPVTAPFTAPQNTGDDSIMIRNWLATSDLLVDWIRARPIVEPEPTFIVETEESL